MSTVTKTRALSLRPHEARRLAERGEVLIVRRAKEDIVFGAFQCDPPDDDVWMTHGPLFGREPDALDGEKEIRCPFGRVGDELWGREAWAADAFKNLRKPHELAGEEIYYRATYPNDSHFMWRSPAQMPACLSRFPRLVVESVECRRLKSVTEDEAIRAGSQTPIAFLPKGCGATWSERQAIKNIWDRQHGPSAWADDVWCWFATMRKVEL